MGARGNPGEKSLLRGQGIRVMQALGLRNTVYVRGQDGSMRACGCTSVRAHERAHTHTHTPGRATPTTMYSQYSCCSFAVTFTYKACTQTYIPTDLFPQTLAKNVHGKPRGCQSCSSPIFPSPPKIISWPISAVGGGYSETRTWSE